MPTNSQKMLSEYAEVGFRPQVKNPITSELNQLYNETFTRDKKVMGDPDIDPNDYVDIMDFVTASLFGEASAEKRDSDREAKTLYKGLEEYYKKESDNIMERFDFGPIDDMESTKQDKLSFDLPTERIKIAHVLSGAYKQNQQLKTYERDVNEWLLSKERKDLLELDEYKKLNNEEKLIAEDAAFTDFVANQWAKFEKLNLKDIWNDKKVATKLGEQMVPFLKSLSNIQQIIDINNAASEAKNGTVSNYSAAVIKRFSDYQNLDKTFMYDIVDGVTDMIGYATEFGIFNLLFPGAGLTALAIPGMTEASMRYFATAQGEAAINRVIAENSLSRIGTMVTRSALQTVTTATPRLVENILEKSLPQRYYFSEKETVQNKEILDKLPDNLKTVWDVDIADDGMPISQAIPGSLWDTFLDNFSERIGEVVYDVTGPIGNNIKSKLFQRARIPIKVKGAGSISEMSQFQGPVIELGEEYVNAFMANKQVPTPEQSLKMLITFSLTRLPMDISDYATEKITDAINRKDEKKAQKIRDKLIELNGDLENASNPIKVLEKAFAEDGDLIIPVDKPFTMNGKKYTVNEDGELQLYAEASDEMKRAGENENIPQLPKEQVDKIEAERKEESWFDERTKALPNTPYTKSEIEENIKHGSFAILTAENPNNSVQTEEYNKKRQDELMADLDEQGIEYYEAVGKYGYGENNIYIPNISPEKAAEIGAKYNQQNVFTKEGLIYNGGKEVTRRINKEDEYDIDYKEDNTGLFTSIKTKDGEVYSFRLATEMNEDYNFIKRDKVSGEIIKEAKNDKERKEQLLSDTQWKDTREKYESGKDESGKQNAGETVKLNLEAESKPITEISEKTSKEIRDVAFNKAREYNIELSDEEIDAVSAMANNAIISETNGGVTIENSIEKAVSDYNAIVNTEDAPAPVKVIYKTPKGSKTTSPSRTYNEAVSKRRSSTGKNLYVRQTKSKSNKNRTLLVQFSSRLLYGDESSDREGELKYYDALYRNVPGYNRTSDFWEVPLWMARVAGMEKNSDVYVIRDIDEAIRFFNEAEYGKIDFSALDVNVGHIKNIVSAMKGQNFQIGGYVDFKDLNAMKNVTSYSTMEEYAKNNNIKDDGTYSYRHFFGTKVIPRLKMSEGCSYKCAFCTVPNTVVSMPMENIDKQVESIKDLNTNLVYLDDKTFGQAKNYKILPEIYNRVKEYNPDFKGFIIQTTSADFQNKKIFNKEYLDKAHIQFVELGIETYNDDILTGLNKQHSHKKFTDKAMQNARDNNIKVIPNIIVGFENETAETYQNTLNFLKKNRDIISHINIYSLALYEGTELSDAIEVKAEADRNENIIEKSFHKNNALHVNAMNNFTSLALDIVESNAANSAQKVNEIKRQMGGQRAGNIDKYYSSHGVAVSFAEMKELEVNERGNYTEEEWDKWADKYGISETDKVIWVGETKDVARSYMVGAEEEYKGREDLAPEEISVSDGFIIPESEDGDGGYLFVYNKTTGLASKQQAIQTTQKAAISGNQESLEFAKIFGPDINAQHIDEALSSITGISGLVKGDAPGNPFGSGNFDDAMAYVNDIRYKKDIKDIEHGKAATIRQEEFARALSFGSEYISYAPEVVNAVRNLDRVRAELKGKYAPHLDMITKVFKSLTKKDMKAFMALDMAMMDSHTEAIDDGIFNKDILNKKIKISGKEHNGKTYSVKDAVMKFREIRDEIFNLAQVTGVDIGYLEDYFPRKIRDVKGYIDWITKQIGERNGHEAEYQYILNELALSEARNKGKEPLTDEQRADVINKAMRGYTTKGSRINVSKGSNTKTRKVAYINKDNYKFYYDTPTAMASYVNSMIETITARQFFGQLANNPSALYEGKKADFIKSTQAEIKRLTNLLPDTDVKNMEDIKAQIEDLQRKIEDASKYDEQFSKIFNENQGFLLDNVEKSIGYVVDKIMYDRGLNSAQRERIRTVLKAVFNPGHKSPWASNAVAASNMMLLGIQTAIKQIDDYTFTALATNSSYAGKALLNTIRGKAKLTMDDIIPEFNQYVKMFDLTGNAGRAMETYMRLTGIRFMDNLQKTILIEAKMLELKDVVKDGRVHHSLNPNMDTDEVIKKMKLIAGDAFEDFKEAVKSEDYENEYIKQYAYSSVADYHPVGSLEQPVSRLMMGNASMVYGLRLFTLNMFRAWRTKALGEVKAAQKTGNKAHIAKAIRNAMTITAYFTMLNGAAGVINSFIFNKPLKPKDIIIDALISSMLGNSYYITGGFSGFNNWLTRNIEPPAISVPLDIIDTMIYGKPEKVLKYITPVGKLYDAWFGYKAKNYDTMFDTAYPFQGEDPNALKAKAVEGKPIGSRPITPREIKPR